MGGGRESNAQYMVVLHLLAVSLPSDEPLVPLDRCQRIVAFLITELSLVSWNEQRIGVFHLNCYQINLCFCLLCTTCIKKVKLHNRIVLDAASFAA